MCVYITLLHHYYITLYSGPQNVVLVQQQQPTATVITHHVRTDFGQGALIFAIIVTGGLFFFGCWWGILCSGIAIFFALNVSSYVTA